MLLWHLFFRTAIQVTSVAPHQNNITAISFNDLREGGGGGERGVAQKSPITIILRCANEGSRHKLKNHSRMWCVNTGTPIVFNGLSTDMTESVLEVNTHGLSVVKMQQLCCYSRIFSSTTTTRTVAIFACAGSKVERRTEISSKQNVSVWICRFCCVKMEWINLKKI